MRTFIKIILLSSVLLVLVLLITIPGKKWAQHHVNYITAVDDHPLNCFRCHLYTQKEGLIAKAVNADYLSPFNMAISSEGARLYVVAQEANELLVVDIDSEKVLDKIAVGERPHSVVLKSDGKTAYVSNQWADNVYEIDLTMAEVVDTLQTGSGPAGLVLTIRYRQPFRRVVMFSMYPAGGPFPSHTLPRLLQR
ncbi:MAG: hypothetical protein AMS26_24365 [Bacteroides sp. SM23_62]|nr:MAG: hypothetical protein AMS26_24365 [Bacteroides sp. SM23_62]